MSRRTVLFGGVSLAVLPGAVQAGPIYTSWRNNRAIGGYDVVSFHDGKPVRGRSRHTYQYDGVLWRFVSARNMERFIEDPSAFEPAYGGYCAWALANGKLAAGNPNYWAVIDGRLYLNFNRKIYRLWERDRDALIAAANIRWVELSDG